MDFHERDQPVDFRLGRDDLGQNSAQTGRVLAQRRADPILARGRGVPLVEDQVDHLEDRSEARHALGPAPDLEPHVRFSEGPFRPDDALGDARNRDEEGPRDLLSRQAAEDAKSERDTCVFGEDRMARHEDEAEEIVPEFLVDRRVQVLAYLIPLDNASELSVLALERLAASDQVGRAMLRGRHQPGARSLWHAGSGPLLERGNEGVLCELLSRPDIADEASQPGDEPGRLDPPDRVDGAMRVGGHRLRETGALRRISLSRTYDESSFTRPRAGRPRGSRRCRRRRVPASTTRWPRRSSAPATASSQRLAPWPPRTARR